MIYISPSAGLYSRPPLRSYVFHTPSPCLGESLRSYFVQPTLLGLYLSLPSHMSLKKEYSYPHAFFLSLFGQSVRSQDRCGVVFATLRGSLLRSLPVVPGKPEPRSVDSPRCGACSSCPSSFRRLRTTFQIQRWSLKLTTNEVRSNYNG